MSTVANMAVILKSRDAEPGYKERTRQQVIHLAFHGNLEALQIVGPTDAKDCPCTLCTFDRKLGRDRAETYK